MTTLCTSVNGCLIEISQRPSAWLLAHSKLRTFFSHQGEILSNINNLLFPVFLVAFVCFILCFSAKITDTR